MTKTILIVEDSPTVRQGITLSLQGAGYRTAEAKDGFEALNKLNEEMFRGLLIDINMPGMDGIALIRHIRNLPNYQQVPILIVTTESELKKKEEGRLVGVMGWIVKPFRPDQLVKAVKQIL